MEIQIEGSDGPTSNVSPFGPSRRAAAIGWTGLIGCDGLFLRFYATSFFGGRESCSTS